MTTILDTVASHITTNWVTGSGGTSPTIDTKLDDPGYTNLPTTNIMVDTRYSRLFIPVGAGVKRELYVIPLDVVTKDKGALSTIKERHDQVITELIRVCDYNNYKMAGCLEHYAEEEVPAISPRGENSEEGFFRSIVNLHIIKVVSR